MSTGKLNPTGKRLRTIILSGPLLVATSVILFDRLYRGKEKKELGPGDNPMRQPKGSTTERR
ncbi:hypothetical protein P389DRAFT_198899 [Cystobasidium minutum MCA 4210]|uniref:uncharacterized protein n=1 Tax=Cystobasidium minutum MCA 4210 TaxID=1397322 RepID=UPI0034CD9794|eukprot:jgi/Rhomi1/198899/gm1.7113_g